MVMNLDLLRQRIKVLESDYHCPQTPLPLGIVALDEALPDKGLARGEIHEIIAGHLPSALGFCAIIAGKLTQNHGPVLWCLPQDNICPQGLSTFGLDPEKVFFAPFNSQKDGLWAVEEGLKTPGLSTVIAEGLSFSLATSRRLHLASRKYGVTALLLLTEGKKCTTHNVAATRWRISSQPSTDAPSFLHYQGIGNIRLLVELLRAKRGTAPHSWLLEWNEQNQCLNISERNELVTAKTGSNKVQRILNA